jgi:hypothetical protein
VETTIDDSNRKVSGLVLDIQVPGLDATLVDVLEGN